MVDELNGFDYETLEEHDSHGLRMVKIREIDKMLPRFPYMYLFGLAEGLEKRIKEDIDKEPALKLVNA